MVKLIGNYRHIDKHVLLLVLYTFLCIYQENETKMKRKCFKPYLTTYCVMVYPYRMTQYIFTAVTLDFSLGKLIVLYMLTTCTQL